MLKKIFDYIAVTSAIYGYCMISYWIYRWTYSVTALSVVIIIQIIIISIPIITYLRRPGILAEYGIGLAASVINLGAVKNMKILENGFAEWTNKRDLVFLERPQPKDLRDLLHKDSKFSLDEIPWKSPDSREIERVRVDSHNISVFWKPNQQIHLNQKYTHECSWLATTNHSELANYSAVLIDLRTGSFRLNIETPYDIEAVFAFRRARLRRFTRDDQVYRFPLKSKKLNCPQPKLSDNKRRIEWYLRDLNIGDSYYCVFFREGGVNFWEEKIRQSSIGPRFIRFLRENLRLPLHNNKPGFPRWIPI